MEQHGEIETGSEIIKRFECHAKEGELYSKGNSIGLQILRVCYDLAYL